MKTEGRVFCGTIEDRTEVVGPETVRRYQLIDDVMTEVPFNVEGTASVRVEVIPESITPVSMMWREIPIDDSEAKSFRDRWPHIHRWWRRTPWSVRSVRRMESS